MPRRSLVMNHAVDPASTNSGKSQLVWFTGFGDLRVHDHAGLIAASADKTGSVIPLFILDPDVHLRYPPSRLALLHTAISSLDSELRERYGVPLILRRGSPETILPAIARESGASAVHVIADDVEEPARKSQRAGCAALEAAGIGCNRWDPRLRRAPWEKAEQQLPGDFPAYLRAIANCEIQDPLGAPDEVPLNPLLIESLYNEGIMPLQDLLSDAEAFAPAADYKPAESTTQPYDNLVRSMGQERVAREALRSYVKLGRDAFADARFEDAYVDEIREQAPSLYAAAAQRLVDASAPSQVLALREAPARAFAPALAVGSLSSPEVRKAAADAGAGPAAVGEDPWWGRSSEGALADIVEWREWFLLLARRSLARQEAGEPATTGQERPQGGDPRAAGDVKFWRWGGQHLVRYLRWDAGPAYTGKTPALLFLHGFAASAEQWERLVFQLRAQASQELGTPADELPAMYAMDLLGFGHAEKPGLSYTQYVWEAQIVDFVREVMDSRDVILVGNSIGGGLGAGAAATIGEACKGVVLCNTAGVLLDMEEYKARERELTRDGINGPKQLRSNATTDALEGKFKDYSPVPFLGQPALDLFGKSVISVIFPQIPTRLGDIYSDRPANADPALIYAIQQGASSPGSANVIGSGQKLADNRPLNEVLALGGQQQSGGFCGPVLVAQGLNDRVSGPKRAQERADKFSTLRDGVTVERITGGHCVQDDAPDAVAAAMLRWLPEVRRWVNRAE